MSRIRINSERLLQERFRRGLSQAALALWPQPQAD